MEVKQAVFAWQNTDNRVSKLIFWKVKQVVLLLKRAFLYGGNAKRGLQCDIKNFNVTIYNMYTIKSDINGLHDITEKRQESDAFGF